MDKGRIYIRNNGKEDIEPLDEEAFELEIDLQKLIADNLELLGERDSTIADARRWLLVKREKGIAVTEHAGSRLFLDHLLVDQDAIPTLVEVKRGSNPDVRRKVVGQMLEYAANAVRTWTATNLRQAFEQTCKELGNDAADELEKILQDRQSPDAGSEPEEELLADEFWDEVATNLHARNLRLLFVADAVPVELERIVEFLNEQMPKIEVLAVEVKRFQNQSSEIFVPRIIGQHAKLRRRGSVSQQVISEGEFLDLCDEHGRAAFSRIAKMAHEESLSFSWGTTRFSLGIQVEHQRIVFCFCSPVGSRDGQIFRTGLYSQGGPADKAADSDVVIADLLEQANKTGLFHGVVGKRGDLKCSIDRAFTEEELDALVGWCKTAVKAIRPLRLKP